MTSYLCGGTRFKLTPTHSGAAFFNFPAELAGRWVALVDATDNRHMNAPATVPLDDVREISARLLGKTSSLHRMFCDELEALTREVRK